MDQFCGFLVMFIICVGRNRSSSIKGLTDASLLLCFETPKYSRLLYRKENCSTFPDLMKTHPQDTLFLLTSAYCIQASTFCTNMGYTYETTGPLCYKVHYDKRSYDGGKLNCNAEGGRLFQIDSPTKQEIAKTFPLKDKPPKYRIEGRYVNNTWTLPSGAIISESYWMENQNSHDLERPCLSINSRHNAKWDNTECEQIWGYICEVVLE